MDKTVFQNFIKRKYQPLIEAKIFIEFEENSESGSKVTIFEAGSSIRRTFSGLESWTKYGWVIKNPNCNEKDFPGWFLEIVNKSGDSLREQCGQGRI
jgi:hypothetical protein